MGLYTVICQASPRTVTLGLLACLFIWSAARSWSSYVRLRHIKGPKLAALTNFWLFYHTCKSRIYLAGEEVLDRYGSLARIGPNVILTNDPSFLRLMAAPRSGFVRSEYFKGTRVDAQSDHLLSTTDEAIHATMRAKVMPGYSGKEVQTLEHDIDQRVVELIDVIRRDYVDQDKSFDFVRLAGFFTMDILTKVAFGNALGFLPKNEDLFDYFRISLKLYTLVECSMHHVSIRTIVQALQKRVAVPSDIGMGALVTAIHQTVRQRFAADPDSEQPADMLASFMRHGLTQQECESEAILQITAGSDSTSHALRVTLYHLITNPVAYRKLIQEIDDAVAGGEVSYPVIKNSEALALLYLRACIMEGLRIFMPLNGISPRLSPAPSGYTYNGVFIPPGTEVGISIYSMLRRKDIFGPDANAFHPERWLDKDTETVKARERVQEMVFGAGRSSCLGKEIALHELRKALFELLRNYDFSLVNPLDGVKTWSNGVVVQQGMIMRAWPRKNE